MVVPIAPYIIKLRKLVYKNTQEEKIEMHLEKRSNPRIDFGILVHHNHKRRMTMDISEQGCFIKNYNDHLGGRKIGHVDS